MSFSRDEPNVEVLVGLRLDVLLSDIHHRLDSIEHVARRANIRDIGSIAIDVVGAAAERGQRQQDWKDVTQSHRATLFVRYVIG
jgi:hypothetical protein